MPLLETKGAASAQGYGLTVGAAAEPVYIEDVMSTFLYTGNGSTQSIVNGIDLAGEGGLVWSKARSLASHNLYDTARGVQQMLSSNSTNAQRNDGEGGATNGLYAFNANGFSVGPDYYGEPNISGRNYASWTFRKQPKFFDVVTYTGDGTNPRAIPHNLGSTPGCVITKSLSLSAGWPVYHRSTGDDQTLFLNATNAVAATTDRIRSVTSTTFTVGNSSQCNQNGVTYVAYLFAHDAGGFGLTGTDNVISCGSYTGTGASGNFVTLGYEPQWVLIKRSSTAGNDWILFDNMRGMPVGSADTFLRPNTTSADDSLTDYLSPTATGFELVGGSSNTNASGNTYIYIAIRRGPMKVPTTGTSVYYPFARAGNDTQTDITGVGFTPDLWMVKSRNIAADFPFFDRLRGVTRRVASNSTFQEESFSGSNGLVSLNMDGITIGAGATDGGICNDTGTNYGNWLLKRAPGFFDEVCYTGTGSATTINHNLGVAPELIFLKVRNNADDWFVRSSAFPTVGSNGYGTLNATPAIADWGDSYSPTATTFAVGTNINQNGSGFTYVAYLFASCPGVSKVGSYTGTGGTQTISCGFAARFVLIKRTNSTGSWWVWDTARGMVAGTDPRLALNSTAAEINDNWVYTNASGFQIVTTDATVNANGSTYIYLAIA